MNIVKSSHIAKPVTVIGAALTLTLIVSACQSTGDSGTELSASTGAEDVSSEIPVSADAFSAGSAATPAQCAIALAAGPPPKPDKSGDFARNAVGRNVGRNLGRNMITQIGGRVGGGLGAAVASGVATSTIRTEQDLDGNWSITDGAPDCGCTLEISAGVRVATGQGANAGSLRTSQCRSILADAARWTHGGRSFTGYDTTLQLLASDRRTVIATLNRDGINYFSGQLANGQPVVMWRRGG